ncbi:MAG: Trk system potassium transporter TrkA [Ruminococcaceae bacterium]|nr:Trk system potassium transporter TrkA [Oscillospiraceae bacterium]
MKIVIIGAGKIGITLTSCLAAENNDVTIIDTDPKTVENTVNEYDVNGVVGNGVNITVQKDAGVNKADVLIATTYSDEINMLCCLIGKKLGVKRTIARIRNPEYTKQFILLLDMMGLDLAVNPEQEAASEMSRLLRYPTAIGMDTFAKGKVDLAEMKVAEGSALDGIKVSEIQRKLNVRLLVCAVQHGEEVYIPNGNSVIQAGDKIHFTASHDQLATFFSKIGAFTKKLKSVLIIGGGRIAYYLARRLLDTGMHIKIVEKDETRCVELSELLPKAEIICGDGTDQALLNEISFADFDSCVAATGIDEENIMISMYAKQCGIEKIITKISKDSMLGMLDSIGIDTIISPKQTTANLILSYCRAMKNSEGSSVQTLYKLVGGKVEALDFRVSETSAVIGKPLFELKLKRNILISCIIRNNTIILPGGSDVILPGDSVIITTTNQHLSDLDDILD